MVVVIDATVAVAASHTSFGLSRLARHELVTPPLMVVEASSVLHEMAWRRELSRDRAREMLERVLAAPIALRSPAGLTEAAWDLADELGWAKTYDAQYVGLARMLGCKLVTLDERLIRGIGRFGIAMRPREV